MAVVIPPGFGLAAIHINGGTGTAPYVTTIGIDLSGVGGDFQGTANAVFGAYAGAWMEWTHDSCSLDRVVLSIGQDGGGLGSIESNANPVQGERTADPAPLAMAPIVRKTTGTLGRRGRGRMFVPCVLASSDVLESGDLKLSTQGSFNNAAFDFFDQLSTGGDPTPPVLLHSSSPGSTGTPTLLTGLTVAPKVGWIRKRIR